MSARRRSGRLLERAAPVALGIGLVVAWHAYVTAREVPSIVLPTPLEVATALWLSRRLLLADAAVTAATAALGLALGALVGGLLAFGMLRSRLFRSISLPYVVGLRIAPVIAIAPLVFLWIGRGIVPRAVVVATLTQFPIAIGMLSGLRSVPEEYLDLLRSVDAPERRLFVSVRLPAAASSVLASAQVAATLAVIGAVVAEFVTLRSGLGYRVFDSGMRLETAEMYAALVALSLVGIGFYGLPRLGWWCWREWGALASRRSVRSR
ncbi:ABC transporter permease [Natrononativus amylolyticus]|uniref:ABC transporter permease n=1 Tax=Natrononativus amylolyticus TaxID=2963434 RepID=UPI0020CFB2A0|nr:ABC transporter permease subunit [Natrononativus amylolyticus]